MTAKRLPSCLLMTTLSCLGSLTCQADTIAVPGDHPTIQQAINAAASGDVITVDAGTYVERLDPNGKAITVRGTVDGSGDPITIVDGNAGGSVNGRIELWRDIDGGAPVHPDVDLELLGTCTISILDNIDQHVAIFDPPVTIPANTNLVVTMYATFSDGYLSVGGNSSPSASATWYRDDQGFCSTEFRDLDVFGYPDFNWVTELSIELGASPCIGDINGDGIVNGSDLSQVLGFWGPCSNETCPADLNGDGSVTGADLSIILGYWGTCP